MYPADRYRVEGGKVIYITKGDDIMSYPDSIESPNVALQSKAAPRE